MLVRLLYIIAGYFLIFLALPVMFKRWLTEPGFGRRWRQSLGFWPDETLSGVAGRRAVWLHAASVGEVVAARPIIQALRRLRPDLTIMLSVVTQTGYAMAEQLVARAVDAVIFYPLDLYGLPQRVLDRVRPRLFVTVETELWPNFLKACHDRRVTVAMVNGRISDQSVRRYRWLGPLLRDMLATVKVFSVQSRQDGEYLVRLGANKGRIVVNGNTKFAVAHEPLTAAGREDWGRLLGIRPGDRVVVAGSTYPFEERGIARCWPAVRQAVTGRVKGIIAPRDIRRAADLCRKLAAGGYRVEMRSRLSPDNPADVDCDFIVVDTIGELGRLYGLADVVFVGGSMFPRGGHNVLEPAVAGKAVVTGEYTFNFRDINTLLRSAGGIVVVKDFAEWQDRIIELLLSPRRAAECAANARRVIEENSGAAERHASLIVRCWQEAETAGE
ncbi:MAG: 3-deoxy-D-manno-octulosonic acid transferase [Negativicutes bacterium]|nr:3-deoxy-D-manno-octulosonic acid transferase [Negativicutes bacterium]